MDTITAFIDGSTYAASVCDHAGWAAGALGAPVVLIHALGRAENSSAPVDLSGNLALGARRTLLEKLAALDAERATLARERGRALLEDAQARTLGAGANDITLRLRRGGPVEALEEVLDTTRLAIIGKRGENASGAMAHLGSNLERLVRVSTRPVLVVNRAYRPITRVLIAYDGGPSAQRAVDRVCESPLLKGAEAHVLTVSGDAGRLAQPVAKLRGAGLTVQDHARPGEPETVIADAVRELDIGLLVLGKSGHSRLRQMFIGSTTLDLMRSCQVPVLIFP